MRSSTATGTIVTAEQVAWRGRFAPSPTGLLHVGSLVTALASFLDVRANGGTWLLRIEDLDTPRLVPGAADDILRTLARLGMQPDEPIVYQSRRQEAYRAALERLRTLGRIYECSCSRRELGGPTEDVAGDGAAYPGHCRNGPRHEGPTATRLRLPPASLAWSDRLRGTRQLKPDQLGDPVIRRRDGITAYQLAVVVDDEWQRVSSVVRGADLLLSTGWQMLLQQALGYGTPQYLHLPLVVEADGSKLGKSRHSFPVEALQPGTALLAALRLLRQQPPSELEGAPPSEILGWAIAHWQPGALQGIHLLPLAPDE